MKIEIKLFFYFQIIEDRIQKDGSNFFKIIENEEKKELYAIYYQNNNMKELYAKYGDTIFVDSTYKLNRNKYPCLVIAVHDNNNCTHIVATAILAYERKHLLDQVIEVFVKDNSAYVNKTKHIMIDKDLKELTSYNSSFLTQIYIIAISMFKKYSIVTSNQTWLNMQLK
jgi:hypothetical protein